MRTIFLLAGMCVLALPELATAVESKSVAKLERGKCGLFAIKVWLQPQDDGSDLAVLFPKTPSQSHLQLHGLNAKESRSLENRTTEVLVEVLSYPKDRIPQAYFVKEVRRLAYTETLKDPIKLVQSKPCRK